MLAPRLAHGACLAVVRDGAVQPLEPHRARASADHLAQRIAAIEPPVSHQLEPHAASLRGMSKLRLARPLQQRPRIGVDEVGIDQMREAVVVGCHMPFALHVLSPQRVAILVDCAAWRVVFDPDVVETLRSCLEADPHDRAFGIEQARRVKPKQARLERVAVAPNGHCLGHQPTSRRHAAIPEGRRWGHGPCDLDRASSIDRLGWIPESTFWATTQTIEAGLKLAAELDRLAVIQNEPNLRSIADCIRLACLPTPTDSMYFGEYRRVGKALVQTLQATARYLRQDLCCQLERFTFGWAALPACTHLLVEGAPAAASAALLGDLMVRHQVAAAEARAEARVRAARKAVEEETRSKREAEERVTAAGQQSEEETVPDHHVVVARLSVEEMKSPKLKEILGPLRDVINTALPLVEVRSLHEVRRALAFEFPYAADVIDFTLADLVGRVTVHIRPLILVGEPGGGKSRFARRLGEILGLSVWREDASLADGAVFGGTARRWYSAEPCHPFLAVARGKTANPLVLIDEIEKAATRNDYGRLWDSLLGFLEPETAARYMDPALQTNLDLSKVSYVATANSLDPLPAPIRDRFRVVSFRKPTAKDLDALLPAVISDLARERGLDQVWVPPLSGIEREVVAKYWHGGSVRRLRRIVEAILRERDINASRN